MRLEASDLVKRYGSTLALDHVPLVLEPGRVHALVGENGAGKSTLVKILGGVERPDRGGMRLDGIAYGPSSAREARRHRVALVFQEVTINPALGVAENVFIDRLGDFADAFGLVRKRRMEDAAQAILDRLDAGISVRDRLDELDLGQWKCIEICRALSGDPEIVLLDESTAFLSRREVRAVLDAIARLKDTGHTVAFISHHLNEVFEVADDLTVLKDGRHVGSFPCSDVDANGLHALMVGRDLAADLYPPRRTEVSSSPLIEFDSVTWAEDTSPLSLALHKGEILGVAGLKHSGCEQILEAVAGIKRPRAGEIRLERRRHAPKDPSEAWSVGVAHLPGDRTGEGLIPPFSVMDNMTLAAMPSTRGLFDGARARAMTGELVRQLQVKADGIEVAVDSLSGGNMQKVLLGKCLATKPRLLLLDNPTRGVDVGARQEIYQVLRRLADEGLGIIIMSEDLIELIGMSDRIAVFRGGLLTRIFDHNDTPGEGDIVAQML